MSVPNHTLIDVLKASLERERSTPTYYYSPSRPEKELNRALDDLKDSLGQFLRDLMRFGLELVIAKRRK